MALPAKIQAATYCKPTFSWKGRRSGPGGRGAPRPRKLFSSVRAAGSRHGGGSGPERPRMALPDKTREAADCGPAFCRQGRRGAGGPMRAGPLRPPGPPTQSRKRTGSASSGSSPAASLVPRAQGGVRAPPSVPVFMPGRSPAPDGGLKGSGGPGPSYGAERPAFLPPGPLPRPRRRTEGFGRLWTVVRGGAAPCTEGWKGSGVSAERAAVAPLPAQDFPAGSSRKFSGNFRKNFPENFPAFFPADSRTARAGPRGGGGRRLTRGGRSPPRCRRQLIASQRFAVKEGGAARKKPNPGVQSGRMVATFVLRKVPGASPGIPAEPKKQKQR